MNEICNPCRYIIDIYLNAKAVVYDLYPVFWEQEEQIRCLEEAILERKQEVKEYREGLLKTLADICMETFNITLETPEIDINDPRKAYAALNSKIWKIYYEMNPLERQIKIRHIFSKHMKRKLNIEKSINKNGVWDIFNNLLAQCLNLYLRADMDLTQVSCEKPHWTDMLSKLRRERDFNEKLIVTSLEFIPTVRLEKDWRDGNIYKVISGCILIMAQYLTNEKKVMTHDEYKELQKVICNKKNIDDCLKRLNKPTWKMPNITTYSQILL